MAAALAIAHLDMNESVSMLFLEENDLRAEGGKQALAAGLKGNQRITELNTSSNKLGRDPGYNGGTSGIIALADAIKGMGAISTAVMYKFSLPIQDIKTKAELNFSAKELTYLDAIVLAALLPLDVS
jgi:hypothetical protein